MTVDGHILGTRNGIPGVEVVGIQGQNTTQSEGIQVHIIEDQIEKSDHVTHLLISVVGRDLGLPVLRTAPHTPETTRARMNLENALAVLETGLEAVGTALNATNVRDESHGVHRFPSPLYRLRWLGNNKKSIKMGQGEGSGSTIISMGGVGLESTGVTNKRHFTRYLLPRQ